MLNSINATSRNGIPAFVPCWQTELSPQQMAGVPVFEQGRGDALNKLELVWAAVDGIFGRCLLAQTRHGVCWIELNPDKLSVERMKNVWKDGSFTRDDVRMQKILNRIEAGESLPLHLRGTGFERGVWKALLGIRPGHVMSYGALASSMGRPTAARAVGRAVGANTIALLVPCHRVLPASGAIGAFRWGSALKESLLKMEQAACEVA